MSISLSLAVTSLELLSKFVIWVATSKSRVSLSLTALGASLTPMIFIISCAVAVWPASSVIV